MAESHREDNPTVKTRRQPGDRLPSTHQRDTLPDGTPVAKLGALWYIVEDESSNKIVSHGYHEIHVEVPRMAFRGVRGARTEEITL